MIEPYEQRPIGVEVAAMVVTAIFFTMVLGLLTLANSCDAKRHNTTPPPNMEQH